MALLKRILNKPDTESLFPKQTKAVSGELPVIETGISAEMAIKLLLENKVFITQVQKNVTERILSILCEQYDFAPTDKYLEEVSKRKKYIGQLDDYLQERRKINNTVENELQLFLQETTSNLTKALDTFTLSIQSRIKQAETKHGIEGIKELLLSSVSDEERV